MTGDRGPTACCGGKPEVPAEGACGGQETPREYFSHMIANCLKVAQAAKAAGRPLVGILCEFTPREMIMAAGALPVCLCGGSAKTILAAEEHLPANLCPLIKSTFGYHALRSNPFLEMAEYRVECIVELIWQACLTYDVESHRVRRLAEAELSLPYLRIETDYSPSDSARISVRLEALFETIRAGRWRPG